MSVFKYTKQDIIEQINHLADGSTPPTQEEFDNSSQTACANVARDKFGSWDQAVKAAGFEPRGVGNSSVSKQTIINSIQNLSEDGDPPTKREFNSHPDTPSARTAEDRFGSWNMAVEAAGYSPRQKRIPKQSNPIDSEQLIQHINRLSDCGRPPEYSEFDDDEDAPPAYLVVKKFGSWENGVEAAMKNR